MIIFFSGYVLDHRIRVDSLLQNHTHMLNGI